MFYASLKSIASYVPDNCIPNDFFTQFLDTSDEWITQRTGIKTRYFANKDQMSSDLGVAAAKLAIERANLTPQDIDLVLCATISPDFLAMPSTACIIAAKLGMSDTPAFDISAACTGFIYGLSIAKGYVESGMYRNVLVIGAEKASAVLDFSDRTTCVLFGDGAGACVVGRGEEVGIKDIHISADGNFSHLLYTPKKENDFTQHEALSVFGTTSESCLDQKLKMKGNEVFKIAVRTIAKDAQEILQKNNMSAKDIDYFVPHQANFRIIQSVGNTLEMPAEKIVLSVQKYGNTSAASIPMALDYAYNNKQFKHRDLLLLDAFGSGFTWGSALIYADFVLQDQILNLVLLEVIHNSSFTTGFAILYES